MKTLSPTGIDAAEKFVWLSGQPHRAPALRLPVPRRQPRARAGRSPSLPEMTTAASAKHWSPIFAGRSASPPPWIRPCGCWTNWPPSMIRWSSRVCDYLTTITLNGGLPMMLSDVPRYPHAPWWEPGKGSRTRRCCRPEASPAFCTSIASTIPGWPRRRNSAGPRSTPWPMRRPASACPTPSGSRSRFSITCPDRLRAEQAGGRARTPCIAGKGRGSWIRIPPARSTTSWTTRRSRQTLARQWFRRRSDRQASRRPSSTPSRTTAAGRSTGRPGLRSSAWNGGRGRPSIA